MDAIARPFGSLLMFIYDAVGNYGLALIILGVIVMMVLLPIAMKAKPGQIRQARLQPKLAELRKKHGDNKQKIHEETQKLWKEEGINPASGCLWGFLPLPIMLILFQVIRQPLTHMMAIPADFLAHEAVVALFYSLLPGGEWTMPAAWQQIEQAQLITAHLAQFQNIATTYFPDLVLRGINFDFLGLNLGLQPQWNFIWTTNWRDSTVWLPGLGLFMIPLVSGGAQFVHTIINKKINPAMSPEGMGGGMGTMMMLMPLLSVWFGFMFPAALGLYWTTQSIIRVGQEVLITKRYTRIVDAEEAVRREEREKKEAELEAKRLETERKKAEGLAERDKNTSKRKKSISEKQEQQERAAEWQKKNAPADSISEEVFEPSRVGNRKYARGRAYDPDRYDGFGGGSDSDSAPSSLRDIDDDDNDFANNENDSYDTDNTADTADESETGSSRFDSSGEGADTFDTPSAGQDESFEVVRDFEVTHSDNFGSDTSASADDGSVYAGEITSDMPDDSSATSTVRFETARFEDRDNDSKE